MQRIAITNIDECDTAFENSTVPEASPAFVGNAGVAAVSTISDMVGPWRAASRLSSAMTASSMLRVVFIQKTIPYIWGYGNMPLRSSTSGEQK